MRILVLAAAALSILTFGASAANAHGGYRGYYWQPRIVVAIPVWEPPPVYYPPAPYYAQPQYRYGEPRVVCDDCGNPTVQYEQFILDATGDHIDPVVARNPNLFTCKGNPGSHVHHCVRVKLLER